MAGVFDLRPLVTTYVNEPLNLSVEDSERNSPLLLKDKITNNLLIRVRIQNKSKCKNNLNIKLSFQSICVTFMLFWLQGSTPLYIDLIVGENDSPAFKHQNNEFGEVRYP